MLKNKAFLVFDKDHNVYIIIVSKIYYKYDFWFINGYWGNHTVILIFVGIIVSVGFHMFFQKRCCHKLMFNPKQPENKY